MGKAESRQKKPTERSRLITFAIAVGLPRTIEGVSYGTPAFRVSKSLFVRLHQDGESLVVKIDADQRACG